MFDHLDADLPSVRAYIAVSILVALSLCVCVFTKQNLTGSSEKIRKGK